MPKKNPTSPSKKGKAVKRTEERPGSDDDESEGATPVKVPRKAPTRNKAIWLFFEMDPNFVPTETNKHAPVSY